MATPILYKFFLQDANDEYYFVDQGGVVGISSFEQPLIDTPKGWEDLSYRFGRDATLQTIVTEVTVAIGFRGDGKKIVQHVLYANNKINTEGYLKLTIKKRNDGDTNVWEYFDWYVGQADFSTVEDNLPDDEDYLYTNLRFYSNDLHRLYEANKDVEYEIPLTGIPESKTIEIQGVKLEGNYNWSVGAIDQVTVPGGLPSVFFVVPMGLVDDDSTKYFRDLYNFTSQGHEIANVASTTPTDSNSFLYVSQALQAEVTVTMDFDWNSTASPAQLRVDLLQKDMLNNTNAFVQTFYDTGAVGGGGGNVQFTSTFTINFLPYQYRYFIGFTPLFSPAQNYNITVNSASMNINFLEALPNTDTAVLSVFDTAKLLVEECFEGQATLQSTYLQTIVTSPQDLTYKFFDLLPGYEYLTSGDALRNISNPVLKIKFADFVKHVQTVHACGIDIRNGIIRIERSSYFYDRSTLTATIQNPKTITYKVATDRMFNKFVVGYPQSQADDLNGKLEVNSQQNYLLPIKSVQNEYDMTSPFKAAVYEIEFLRSANFGDETRDNQKDNNVYILQGSQFTNNGKILLLKYAPPDFVYNVPDPTGLYNIAYSPRRNASRQFPLLKSVLENPDVLQTAGTPIEFISSDRFSGLQTIFGGNTITENAPTLNTNSPPTTSAEPKLFRPYYVSCNIEPQEGFLDAVRANPHGYLILPYNGGEVLGFIEDLEVIGTEREQYSLTLLLTPDSNIETLKT